MHYSIEQDKDTEKYCLYDTDTGKKLSEWDTRRQATREMGRLQREGDTSKKAGDKKPDEDEEDDE